MVNSNELKAIFVKAGKNQRKVAELVGLSLTSLNNKILNKSEFKASEIKNLCDVFKIENPEEIFFATDVEK